MIHYNPNKHHDKLMKHIAAAYISGYELDQPLVPLQNNGTPLYALYTGDETYLFADQELRQQLFIDAINFEEDWRKRHKIPKGIYCIVEPEQLDKFCVLDFLRCQGTSARSEWRDGKVIQH